MDLLPNTDLLDVWALVDHGLLPDQEIVDWAVEALVGGRDGPAVMQLASLLPGDLEHARRCFAEVFAELHGEVPPASESLRRTAIYVAARGLDGSKDADECIRILGNYCGGAPGFAEVPEQIQRGLCWSEELVYYRTEVPMTDDEVARQRQEIFEVILSSG